MKAVPGIIGRMLRDPSTALGMLIVVLLIAVALLAPLLATHPDAVWNMNPRHRLLPPSEQYYFGTDRMGADIYSRILFGARITLTIACLAVGAHAIGTEIVGRGGRQQARARIHVPHRVRMRGNEGCEDGDRNEQADDQEAKRRRGVVQ